MNFEKTIYMFDKKWKWKKEMEARKTVRVSNSTETSYSRLVFTWRKHYWGKIHLCVCAFCTISKNKGKERYSENSLEKSNTSFLLLHALLIQTFFRSLETLLEKYKKERKIVESNEYIDTSIYIAQTLSSVSCYSLRYITEGNYNYRLPVLK